MVQSTLGSRMTNSKSRSTRSIFPRIYIEASIDVKTVFYVFFIQGTFFLTFFNVFYFANVFYF